jgi:cellulose synthase/poly-beta-1,6-N-acetylglucosamine synthase-like glycosyltransferase
MMAFILYFTLFFAVYLVLLVLINSNRPPAQAPYPDTPLVSILVAVRNEEAQIIRCLESLARLHYPAEKIEILLGDDASTDHTAALIRQFIRDKPQFRYLLISGQLGRARGKANVLAHLARAAASDFYFITDADISLPPDWIRRMLAGLQADTGIVTGITTIGGQGLFPRMQALDWLHALGLMQVVSDLGFPVSTMGNNMLITRQAYAATGGYESLPFSLTEDVQLFQAVIRQGFATRNIFDAGVLAVSTPAPSWRALWQQRKRWMVGVPYLPWYMVLLAGLYACFYALCGILAIFAPGQVVAGLLFCKLMGQTAFIHSCLRRLGLQMPLPVLLLFEFYLIFVSLITFLYFLLPVKITWKGREY